jgi:tRNA 5-methylaminomethyl-2-thiouridine biosynthesis bifunctional protein
VGHKKVAIIGGGLAGTACAYVLRQKGHEPIIFEKTAELAHGASGNNLGLYNPRFYAEARDESYFYRDAFIAAAEVFSQAGEEIDHVQNGGLHLIPDETKAQRFGKVMNSGVWQEGDIRFFSAKEASDFAGVDIPYDAVSLVKAGSVCPHKLCHYYAGESKVRYNVRLNGIRADKDGIWHVDEELFDAVILACGANVKDFAQTSWIPVYTVRGQIIEVEATAYSSSLKTDLRYGGYISAAHNGRHVVGSTFQKWIKHTEIRDEDSAYILDQLHQTIPEMRDVSIVCGARASMRCTTPQRLPVIGAVPDQRSLFVSTAHGSHGLVTTLQAAYMIAEQVEESSVSYSYTHIFSPAKLKERLNKVTG